jgi:hypothetical protein
VVDTEFSQNGKNIAFTLNGVFTGPQSLSKLLIKDKMSKKKKQTWDPKITNITTQKSQTEPKKTAQKSRKFRKSVFLKDSRRIGTFLEILGFLGWDPDPIPSHTSLRMRNVWSLKDS